MSSGHHTGLDWGPSYPPPPITNGVVPRSVATADTGAVGLSDPPKDPYALTGQGCTGQNQDMQSSPWLRPPGLGLPPKNHPMGVLHQPPPVDYWGTPNTLPMGQDGTGLQTSSVHPSVLGTNNGMISNPISSPPVARHPRAVQQLRPNPQNHRYKRTSDEKDSSQSRIPKKSRSDMDSRHQEHAKPAADPEKGVKVLTQQQLDKLKQRETLQQQKVEAQQSRDRAETELHDIQKQVRDISSLSDLRPVGTNDDVPMLSPNKFDDIIAPPEPSHDIQSEPSLVSQIKPEHIIARQYPHPRSTEHDIKEDIPINIDTHVLLSSLVSNPDYRRSDRTIVHLANVIFDNDGPSIILKSTKESTTPHPPVAEGGGALVVRDTTSVFRTQLNMTIHPNGFQYVQLYEHDATTIQLGIYGIEQPIPVRVHPSLRHIMHRSMQTFVGFHRQQVNSYNDDTHTPKIHHFYKSKNDGPMELSTHGDKITFATVRMFATYREKGKAIVTVKCTSDPDDIENSTLSIYEPNRHTVFPLHDITIKQVAGSRVKGVPVPESLQISVPLTTKGDQTVTRHTMAFQLMPSDVKLGLSVSIVATTLNNVRITDIASRRAKDEPNSIDNKLKTFFDDTEPSKTTIILADSNKMSHDINFSHVQNESSSAHPMRLLSSPGLKMGQAAALASTLPKQIASFVTLLMSDQHRTWLHLVPEKGHFGKEIARDKYITQYVNKLAQHLITISEQCIVTAILLIPSIPHDPNSDVQELVRARLTETLLSHYKIVIIDQYDGDDGTSAQRRRAWQADEASYYGHPSSSPQQPTFTQAAQLDMCSALCYRARLLSATYNAARITAVAQGSYLYQNSTGLPDDTGYDDTMTPLTELSICDTKPSASMHSGAAEQRQLYFDSHDLLSHMQANFHLKEYDAKEGTPHYAVFNMLQSSTEFYVTSYENTDEAILHTVSTRVADLHLQRHEPTSVNLNALTRKYGDNNYAKHIVRQTAAYFEPAREKPLSYSTQIALCSTHAVSSTMTNASLKVDARLESEHTEDDLKDALYDSFAHDQKCRVLHSLTEINQHLAHAITNVSLSPKRDVIPTKFRDKHKFLAIKKQNDTKAGVMRWEPQSGTLRDLQYSAAISGLPLSLIHVTPTRAEPYEIKFFDKYKTMDDSISSAGTNVPLDAFPLASPAERLKHYIRTKLTEGHLIILQIHTGPQQHHFATVTKLRTPLDKGFHDHYIPVTNIVSASTSDVVNDILAAKGIPHKRAQPTLAAAPALQNPSPATAGPSPELPSDPPAAETDGTDGVVADADATSASTPSAPLGDGAGGTDDGMSQFLSEDGQHSNNGAAASSHSDHTSN